MNRSKLYQHKIVEISFDQGKLSNFSTERGIGHILTANACDERISELKNQLMNKMYEIIKGDYLTSHQKKILTMRLTGKTQNEIAKHLGITQSAVHKAMHGNIDYKNNKKRYGGIVKKIKKYCIDDEEINAILSNIAAIKLEPAE